MPLPEFVLPWLDETDSAPDVLDVSMLASRVAARLQMRDQDRETIECAKCILAPLDFWTYGPARSAWNSYFAPRMAAGSGREEYPCLSRLTQAEVEEWARLTSVLQRPVVRARFADAVWELGKRFDSERKDFHRYAQMAAEFYLEAADANIGRKAACHFLRSSREVCLWANSFGALK